VHYQPFAPEILGSVSLFFFLSLREEFSSFYWSYWLTKASQKKIEELGPKASHFLLRLFTLRTQYCVQRTAMQKAENKHEKRAARSWTGVIVSVVSLCVG